MFHAIFVYVNLVLLYLSLRRESVNGQNHRNGGRGCAGRLGPGARASGIYLSMVTG